MRRPGLLSPLNKKCSPAESRTALLIWIQTDYRDLIPVALILAKRAFVSAEGLTFVTVLHSPLFADDLVADFAFLTLAHRAV